MTYLFVALIGLLGGFVSGLVGVGGGTVFVPLLILLLKFNPHLAIGTSLAIIIPTTVYFIFTRGVHTPSDNSRKSILSLSEGRRKRESPNLLFSFES